MIRDQAWPADLDLDSDDGALAAILIDFSGRPEVERLYHASRAAGLAPRAALRRTLLDVIEAHPMPARGADGVAVPAVCVCVRPAPPPR